MRIRTPPRPPCFAEVSQDELGTPSAFAGRLRRDRSQGEGSALWGRGQTKHPFPGGGVPPRRRGRGGFRRSDLQALCLGLLCAIASLCLTALPASAAIDEAEDIVIDIPLSVGGFGLSFFEDAARAYSQATPGVRVHLYGDPRMGDQVRIRIIEGSYPSASNAWGVPWFNLIQSGKVLDLGPYLSQSNWEGTAPWRDSFLPGSLDRWRDDDHFWAVPFDYAVYAIFYNKAMFREQGWTVPTTWDGLFELCERIEEAGLAPFSFPGMYMQYADWFLKAAHYNLVGPDGYRAYQRMEPGSRSSPEFIRAAEIVQRLATTYFQPGWKGMSHTSAQLEFFQGRAAMMANGSWLVSEMQGKIPDDFELGTFNFPVFPEGRGAATAIQVGSGFYFLLSENPYVDQTVDFFRFLTSRSQATIFARAQDTPTAIQGVPTDSYSPLMQDVSAIIQSSTAAYGVPPGTAAAYPGMSQAFNDARHELLMGRIEPAEFAEQLEAAAERARVAASQPDKLVIRHLWKGLGLILLMAAAIGFTAITQWRRAREPADQRELAGEPTVAMSPINTLLFLGPALLLYLLFTIKPCFEAFAWAFSEWDGISERTWVGFQHFASLLFASDVFWKALGNNLFIMFVPTAFVVPLSLFFSYLISRGVWGRNLFRICFFFPNILGGIAVTLLWMNAYNPKGGLINGALTRLGFTSFQDFAWLSQDVLYWSLIPMAIWGACGFNMILYLAGMESVDHDLYEASSIDGATPWQQFVHITVPMIWEILVISIVFMVIGGLKAFEVIWLLTNQQPTSNTHVIGTWMVTTMFQDFKVGQATAIAVILFILVFFGTLATMRLMKREAIRT